MIEEGGQRRLEAELGQFCPQSPFRSREDRAGSVLACSLSLRWVALSFGPL